MQKEEIQMKEEFIIGEKAKSRTHLIVHLLLESIMFYLFYQLFINMITNTPFFILYPDTLKGIKIMFLFIYLFLIFVELTSESFKQYITISKDYLCYYSNIHFISQIINSFCILFNKERKPALKISVHDIKKIVLLYNTITSSFYFKGHSIVYHIELNDGTSLTINPESFHFKNDNIVEGIEYIRDLKVTVDDPYQLIDGLKNKQINFADYIEKVVIAHENHL